jgi:hypothetical protein
MNLHDRAHFDLFYPVYSLIPSYPQNSADFNEMVERVRDYLKNLHDYAETTRGLTPNSALKVSVEILMRADGNKDDFFHFLIYEIGQEILDIENLEFVDREEF